MAAAVHAYTGSVGGTASAAVGLTLAADGNYYGVSTRGGANQGKGAFFRITADGAQKVLYSFGASSNDAIEPDAPLIQGTDGNLYGTSTAGGAYGDGTVYRVTPAGAETVLYSFSGSTASDPASPAGGLIQGADGNFYGTTRAGGAAGTGVVFRLTPAGAISVLNSFGPSHGGDANTAVGELAR